MITFGPFENVRVRTRKVLAALDEIGALPVNRSDQPSFLRGRRIAEYQLNEALAAVGSSVELTGKPRLDAMSLNSAFGSIDVGDGPVEPLIFADFKNGAYMADGDTVALADLFVENLDWSAWDPSKIINGVGLTAVGDAHGAVLHSDFDALVSAGITVVPTAEVAEGSGSLQFQVDWLNLPSYTPDVSGVAAFAEEGEGQNGGTIGGIGGDGLSDIEEIGSVATPKIAFNLSATRVAMSVNGRAVVGADVSLAVASTLAFLIQSPGSAVTTIGIYPLQDEADLPILSAI